MSRTAKLVAVTTLIGLAACYHATIDTGLPPSPQVVDKPWASGWIYGLVPPKTIETMAKCPNGVSKVETQLSFVNQLVNFLTLGIYTPMSIKVTCASGSRAAIPQGASKVELGANPTVQDLQDALGRAAALSARIGAPVYIQH